nr:glutathione S-transferase family protein [Rhizobiaceae bacterium]
GVSRLPMLPVYAIPPSLYCAKLRIVLRAKGLEWREIPPPGGYGSDTYKALVPTGNLPALADGDLLIADSEAIAEYLEERYREPPLLPPDTALRAKMRERGRFHDTRLEPALRTLFATIAPQRRDPAFTARQSAEMTTRLQQLARMLERDPELAFGLGDCGFPITFAWIDALRPVLGLDVSFPDSVRTYRARIEAHPPVAAELASYRSVLDAWVARTVGAPEEGADT